MALTGEAAVCATLLSTWRTHIFTTTKLVEFANRSEQLWGQENSCSVVERSSGLWKVTEHPCPILAVHTRFKCSAEDCLIGLTIAWLA